MSADKKTIRTISQLDNLFTNDDNSTTILTELSSDNVFFEFSKMANDDDCISTYKISGKQLFDAIYSHILNITDKKYVDISSTQTISGEKTFTNNVILKNELDNTPLLIANTPLSAVALSANWN